MDKVVTALKKHDGMVIVGHKSETQEPKVNFHALSWICPVTMGKLLASLSLSL